MPNDGTTPRPIQSFSGRLSSWLGDKAVAAVTLGGLAIYVILRLPYSIYYARLGTSPEEVGLSYLELLSKSTLGLTVSLVTIALLVFIPTYLWTLRGVLEKTYALSNAIALNRQATWPQSGSSEANEFAQQTKDHVKTNWSGDLPHTVEWLARDGGYIDRQMNIEKGLLPVPLSGI
jgi:hypothetical protein